MGVLKAKCEEKYNCCQNDGHTAGLWNQVQYYNQGHREYEWNVFGVTNTARISEFGWHIVENTRCGEALVMLTPLASKICTCCWIYILSC